MGRGPNRTRPGTAGRGTGPPALTQMLVQVSGQNTSAPVIMTLTSHNHAVTIGILLATVNGVGIAGSIDHPLGTPGGWHGPIQMYQDVPASPAIPPETTGRGKQGVKARISPGSECVRRISQSCTDRSTRNVRRHRADFGSLTEFSRNIPLTCA